MSNPDYLLYCLPGAASMVPHIILEEIGTPYKLHYIDKAGGELQSPAYTALNPNRRVPTLIVDKDGAAPYAVFETPAICQILAEAHPEANLLPPVGTPERANILQWIAWLSNTIHPDVLGYFYPTRFVPEDAAETYKARMVERLAVSFAIIDDHLAGKIWLAGEQYTIADPYLFACVRWTRNMSAKARDLPNIGRFAERIYARSTVQAVFAAEALTTDPAY